MRRHRSLIYIFFLPALLYSPTFISAATVTGRVLDLDGNGIQNVQVNVTGDAAGSDVTLADGSYSIGGLAGGGSYTLTPVHYGKIFTPNSWNTSSLPGDVNDVDFVFGKVWTGLGADALASNPDNWSGTRAPEANDIVRFDATNPNKGCVWNSTMVMTSFQMKAAFSSSVVVTADMNMMAFEQAGGLFNMSNREIRISSGFIQTGGTFIQSAGGSVYWDAVSYTHLTLPTIYSV